LTPLTNRFRLNNNSDIPGKHRDVTPAEEAAYIASSKTNVAAPFKKKRIMSMLAVAWRFWFFLYITLYNMEKKLHINGLTDRENQKWIQ
jgi:hypothetical protein